MSRVLWLVAVLASALACIIEEPSPLGRPCNEQIVCGPDAVCDPQTNLCVSPDQADGGSDTQPPDFAIPPDNDPDGPDASADQPTDQPTDQSDDQPTDQSDDQPTDQSDDQPSDTNPDISPDSTVKLDTSTDSTD